jgi:hypothetical protein
MSTDVERPLLVSIIAVIGYVSGIIGLLSVILKLLAVVIGFWFPIMADIAQKIPVYGFSQLAIVFFSAIGLIMLGNFLFNLMKMGWYLIFMLCIIYFIYSIGMAIVMHSGKINIIQLISYDLVKGLLLIGNIILSIICAGYWLTIKSWFRT